MSVRPKRWTYLIADRLVKTGLDIFRPPAKLRVVMGPYDLLEHKGVRTKSLVQSGQMPMLDIQLAGPPLVVRVFLVPSAQPSNKRVGGTVGLRLLALRFQVYFNIKLLPHVWNQLLSGKRSKQEGVGLFVDIYLSLRARFFRWVQTTSF